MKRKTLEENKAKVRHLLKVLRSKRCTNFVVIGAGDWAKPRGLGERQK